MHIHQRRQLLERPIVVRLSLGYARTVCRSRCYGNRIERSCCWLAGYSSVYGTIKGWCGVLAELIVCLVHWIVGRVVV